MTGNTKVWRAPLAGLASVAMIATMGVAASTANAATDYVYPGVTVTLDTNGGSFADTLKGITDQSGAHNAKTIDFSKDGKTVTVTDKNSVFEGGYAYADGIFPSLYSYFGYDGTNGANGNIKWDGEGARVFSGWYTEKQGGQAVDPTTALADGTTLYAHWSQGAVSTDESEQVVKLDTKGEVVYASDPDGAANVVDATNFEVRLADGDTLADWELPSKDAAVNHVVPTWENASSAKAGDTLVVKQNEGATVSIKRTAVAPDAGAQYDLYKDGVAVNTTKASYDFDVLTGTALDEYQAVTSGTNKKLANAWQLTYGGKTSDYEFGTAFPSDAKDVVLAVKGGQQSTVVRVHKWSQTGIDQRFFVPRGQSFQSTFGKTLDEVSRPNTSFLGWYSYTDKDSNGQQTNDNYFDPNLIQKNDEVEQYGTPSVFDFTTTLNGESFELYAGYRNDARFTTITLDPNYSGADKISVKIYAGKKIGEQLPTVTRDGYTLTAWWDSSKPTSLSSKLDTDKKATTNPDYPAAGSTWYAQWTADSKDNAQLNGLLNNLSRFYVVANASGDLVVSDGSNANFVQAKATKDKDGKTVYVADSSAGFLEVNPGYVKTSYEKFVAARKSVVSDLKKELKLANSASIADVYTAVQQKLSAEKADTYNRKLANILVGEADFPDVNTSDTDSHTDSIQFMYNQGIVKGYADGTFGYGAPVARVDFIVWLYRAAGSPAVDSQASFTDVTAATVPNQEFRDAIAWAAANKITTGYAGGTFAPYVRIVRQDAAAFIYRAAGSPNYIEDYNSKVFADVTPGDSANHSKAVLWANNNGVVKGFAGSVNRFAGLDTVARQDAAAFLARAIQANLL